MTCIVGLVSGPRVYIGGDSAAVSGWRLTIRSDAKVFVRRPFIMGFTTSFRMGQLLRYGLELPEHSPGVDVFEFMATSFVDAVRECLSRGGVAKTENGVEQGGEFLVGYRGRLFHVQADYQVSEAVDGVDAVGGGAEVALGALFAGRGRRPTERLRLALEAAEHHVAGVRGPFVVESLR